MTKEILELFDSEWAILRVVWNQEPCAAPMVKEALEKEKGWAYTTVKTMMDRMVKKRLLKVQKFCNLCLYSSAVTQSQARKGEIIRMLKRAFDGSLTPMMEFLIESEKLSEAEYRRLESMFRNRRRRKSTSKKK